jgi:hypothetical protein
MVQVLPSVDQECEMQSAADPAPPATATPAASTVEEGELEEGETLPEPAASTLTAVKTLPLIDESDTTYEQLLEGFTKKRGITTRILLGVVAVWLDVRVRKSKRQPPHSAYAILIVWLELHRVWQLIEEERKKHSELVAQLANNAGTCCT